jgi:O-antigen ligase
MALSNAVGFVGRSSFLGSSPDSRPIDILVPWLRRSFRPLFRVYIALIVVVPSGSILGLNFKIPLYALLLPAAVVYFFSNRHANRTEIGLLLFIPTLLVPWIVVAQFYGFDIYGSVRQYADILLTFLTCWLATVYCERTTKGSLSLLRMVLYAEAFASAIKVALLGYAFLRGVPITEMVALLDKVFGVELMTMDLGTLLGRIQFVSDGLIPVCIFALLRYRQALRIGALQSGVVLLLMVISVIFSFSRYFWAFSVLAFGLGLLLGRKDKFFFVVLTFLIGSSLLSLPLLKGLVEARFSQEVVSGSDDARVEQIAALKQFFFDAPLVGHGLGSYTPSVIRSDTDAKYGYEVQILALSGQVGILGLLILSALCMFYFRELWPRSRSELAGKVAVLFLLLCWLAAGLFNPLLLNPVGAVSYASLLCLGRMAGTPDPSGGPRQLSGRGKVLVEASGKPA